MSAQKWKIVDADGNWVNNIVSNLEFVTDQYPNCTITEVPEYVLPLEITAKDWRNSELASTDQASQTPDWPNRDNILLYRTALRDWPSTADFPNKKPTLST